MFEEAEALRGTIELCHTSQSEIAKRLGVSQSYVANKLRLLKLDKDEREAVLAGGLTERHARALLRLRDRTARREALEKIISRGLTVHESEALVDYLYTAELPRTVGRAERGEHISSFKSALGECLAFLKSEGIEAQKTVGYYGTKTYITIAIDEG